jgi:competence protein ComEA
MEAPQKTSDERTREEIIERRERVNTALAVLVIFAVAFGIVKWYFSTKSGAEIIEPAGSTFAVTITGAVEVPDTYTVREGDTIENLVILAGGFHEYADRDAVRLGEILNETYTKVVTIPFTADYEPPPKPPKPGEYEYPININSADERELQALKGIGPSLARRIVEYREENGPFQKPAEIMNVNGMGLEKYKEIHGLITVDDEETQ